MSDLVWSDDGGAAFRLYAEGEAEREFGETIEEIFGPLRDLEPLFARKAPERTRIFANPDWTVFAVEGHFLACHEILPDSADDFLRFVEEEDSGFAFPEDMTDSELRAVANGLERDLIARHANPDPLKLLFQRSVEAGMTEAIQATVPLGNPLKAACCYPARCLLDRSRDIEPYLDPTVCRCLFDRTGLWGVYSDEDDFCLVGGEASVMAPIVEDMGGMSAIKARFDEGIMRLTNWERNPGNHVIYGLTGWCFPAPSG